MSTEQPRDWKTPFLTKLSESGNVSRACTTAKVARNTAYRHRAEDPEFAAAWEEAIQIAVGLLEDEAWRRACVGTIEPIYWKGEKCGEVKKYSDVLLIFLLKAHKPNMYRETVNQRHSGAVALQVTGLEDLSDDALDRLIDGETGA